MAAHNAETIDRLWALKASGYIDAVTDWAKLHCAPVFWRDETGLRNGTMTFVNTGAETLGVTAGHVAGEVLAYAGANPEGSCRAGAAELDPRRRFIDRHRSLDLATFRLSEPFLAAAGHYAAVPLRWPPSAAAVGDLVLFAGFPSQYRSERESEVDFDMTWFAGNLESQSENNSGLVLRIATSLTTLAKPIPAHADLGGWSGGPMFILSETNDPRQLALLEVAGIIYEYSASSEIALAHPLAHVAADGRF